MTLQVVFLLSPLLLAAVAQGLCIKYGWLERLKRPLDLGLHFRGKRLFGEHKTFRGLFINVASCILGTVVQGRLQGGGLLPHWLPLLNYTAFGYAAGLLMGLGMTAGELPNSFLKRQWNLPAGGKTEGPLGLVFFVFDQVDMVIGMWAFLFLIVRPSARLILLSLPLFLVLHVAVSTVGYLLGMRKTMV